MAASAAPAATVTLLTAALIKTISAAAHVSIEYLSASVEYATMLMLTMPLPAPISILSVVPGEILNVKSKSSPVTFLRLTTHLRFEQAKSLLSSSGVQKGASGSKSSNGSS